MAAFFSFLRYFNTHPGHYKGKENTKIAFGDKKMTICGGNYRKCDYFCNNLTLML